MRWKKKQTLPQLQKRIRWEKIGEWNGGDCFERYGTADQHSIFLIVSKQCVRYNANYISEVDTSNTWLGVLRLIMKRFHRARGSHVSAEYLFSCRYAYSFLSKAVNVARSILLAWALPSYSIRKRMILKAELSLTKLNEWEKEKSRCILTNEGGFYFCRAAWNHVEIVYWFVHHLPTTDRTVRIFAYSLLIKLQKMYSLC